MYVYRCMCSRQIYIIWTLTTPKYMFDKTIICIFRIRYLTTVHVLQLSREIYLYRKRTHKVDTHIYFCSGMYLRPSDIYVFSTFFLINVATCILFWYLWFFFENKLESMFLIWLDKNIFLPVHSERKYPFGVMYLLLI